MSCASFCIRYNPMLLTYENKKSVSDILGKAKKAALKSISDEGAPNKLIRGDNLRVMRALLDDYRGKVDLIYTDPPFATNKQFRIGAERANTVSSSRNDAVAYSDTLVGANYMEFIRERLILLRELLSEHGSIYLHIDYKIGHYIKVLMDEVFGRAQFRNDITRIKCNPKNFPRKAYGNIKDLILFYSKSELITWNDPRLPFTEEDKARLFRKVDAEGRMYTTIPLHAPGETLNGVTGKAWRGILPPQGRHWRSAPEELEELDRQGLIEWSVNGVPRRKVFAEERQGKRVQDIWTFKDPQYPDYPTQKSVELLKFIIEASSNERDLVLDCFCGSGTTLFAAQELNRRWIGIDESAQAIAAARKRLNGAAGNLFSQNGYELMTEARP